MLKTLRKIFNQPQLATLKFQQQQNCIHPCKKLNYILTRCRTKDGHTFETHLKEDEKKHLESNTLYIIYIYIYLKPRSNYVCIAFF